MTMGWDARDDEREDDRGRDRESDGGVQTVVKSKYWEVGDGSRKLLYDQLYYAQNRATGGPEEPGPRSIFTANTAGINRKQGMRILREREDTRVQFHREIMAPAPVWGLRSEEDLQRWTRDVMTALEDHLGVRLAWVACVHRNTIGHPHVHALISGAAVRSDDGKQVRVRLTRSAFAQMRRAGVWSATRTAEARAVTERHTARERQAARMTALDRRLGVVDLPTPIDTPAQAIPLAPASQAAPKRRWWQQGN